MEVRKPEEKNVVDSKQREVIKKQMKERKKSAGEKLSNRSAAKQKGVDNSAKKSAENSERLAIMEEKSLKGGLQSELHRILGILVGDVLILYEVREFFPSGPSFVHGQ